MLFSVSINAQNHYTAPTPNSYPGYLTFIIQIDLNGVTLESDNIELGAFINGTVRGSERIQLWGNAQRPRAYINIYGNSDNDANAEITFKIYDHTTGQEYLNYEASYPSQGYDTYEVVWSQNAPLGQNSRPIVLNFTTYNKDITHYSGTDNGWYLIASPIGEVAPSRVMNMLENTHDLYYFDQNQELEWVNYYGTEGAGFNLEPGKGYLYANSSDVTLMFNGSAYNESGAVTLAYEESAKWSGVNLIGNPFATSATLDMPYYRLNYDGTFESLTENTPIEAMEGVIVRVDAAGTANFTATAKRGTAVIPQVNILVTSNRGKKDDNAIIRFDGGATLGKYQLFEDNAQVYIPQNGREYAVVDAGTQGELPLNFKATKNGSYTFSFNTENMTMNYFHLIDNLTGNDVDLLTTPSYSFEARTDDYASRFRLVFTTSDNDENQIAFISNGEIVLNGVNGYTTVQLIDVNGRILSNLNGANRISTEDLAAGVYMIRLINGSDVKTQKIVLK